MPGRVTRSRSSLNDIPGTSGAKRPSSDGAPPEKKRRKTANANATSKGDAPASRPHSSARKGAAIKKPKPDLEQATQLAAKIQADPASTSVSPSKAKQKANPYNLSPGASPYPSYERPTPQECRHVHKLLTSVHGKVSAPKTIPAPNLQSSGCGEVPSVLDALIRTRLSAATNNANSSRAFRGLVDKFGIIKEGVGKGSVDWDKVRRAPIKDVFEAIQSGGLADVKSRDIQKILTMVYEEMQERGGGKAKDKNPVLSLDHLHSMGNEEAFDKLLGYPGVGPKTASCVLLFCMQRPSFAVDTHVFRIVSWLGWIPPDAAARRMAMEAKAADNGSETRRPPPPPSRNTAYAHLDVRIPDDLKYPLHYLFIRHGKTCPSCAAKKDSKVTAAWGDKKCPLAGLKSGKAPPVDIKEEAGDTDGESHVPEDWDAVGVKTEDKKMHGVEAA